MITEDNTDVDEIIKKFITEQSLALNKNNKTMMDLILSNAIKYCEYIGKLRVKFLEQKQTKLNKNKDKILN